MEGLGGLLEASWGHLKVSWRPLGASEGHLGGVLKNLRGVWRRFEASSRPPGGASEREGNDGGDFGGSY